MDNLVDNPVEWGRQLILTFDHDPLYQGLVDWNPRGSRLRRYLLAYWCCYSVGASYYLSQHSGTRFWDALEKAARNVEPTPHGDRWPRAHERRHWRGDKCVNSVLWLRETFRHPEEAVISLEECETLKEVEQSMTKWPQFGPWIAFKAADMLERVLGAQVEFPSTLISLYKDPQEGAGMAAQSLGFYHDQPGGSPQQRVVQTLLEAYGQIEAPGQPTRNCNIQEVETVLCKWKSARKGHYKLGMDTRDHRAELAKWNATDLLAAYPRPAD